MRVRYYSLDVMKTASVDVQLGWATYVRAADEAAAAATPKKEEQLGEWYLRTAELYAETAGDAAAQQVVEQVRGALLNSADREQCYLIRARAYLQLANFDNAKRDLGASHSLPAASPFLAHRHRRSVQAPSCGPTPSTPPPRLSTAR